MSCKSVLAFLFLSLPAQDDDDDDDDPRVKNMHACMRKEKERKQMTKRNFFCRILRCNEGSPEQKQERSSVLFVHSTSSLLLKKNEHPNPSLSSLIRT